MKKQKKTKRAIIVLALVGLFVAMAVVAAIVIISNRKTPGEQNETVTTDAKDTTVSSPSTEPIIIETSTEETQNIITSDNSSDPPAPDLLLTINVSDELERSAELDSVVTQLKNDFSLNLSDDADKSVIENSFDAKLLSHTTVCVKDITNDQVTLSITAVDLPAMVRAILESIPQGTTFDEIGVDIIGIAQSLLSNEQFQTSNCILQLPVVVGDNETRIIYDEAFMNVIWGGLYDCFSIDYDEEITTNE